MDAIEQAKLSLAEISGHAVWSMEICGDWEQQLNNSDCGVFVCVGCECLALGLPMMMISERGICFRDKIGVDLINGHLS
jgi:Ulp1 family protease